jgi:hypothetical protein
VSLEQPSPQQAPVAERVRLLVSELDGIETRPLGEHAERYSQAHVQLQAALSEIDGGAGG